MDTLRFARKYLKLSTKDKMQTCIRPILLESITPGPDGIRLLSPHHSYGFKEPLCISGFKSTGLTFFAINLIFSLALLDSTFLH